MANCGQNAHQLVIQSVGVHRETLVQAFKGGMYPTINQRLEGWLIKRELKQVPPSEISVLLGELAELTKHLAQLLGAENFVLCLGEHASVADLELRLVILVDRVHKGTLCFFASTGLLFVC